MGWKIIGESVAGTSHSRAKLPCQDAHRFARRGEASVLVVADGAGSATLAQAGAECAAEAVVQFVLSHAFPQSTAGWEAFLRVALDTGREAVIVLAQTRGVAVRELASTLILAVVLPDRVAVVQVGDGAAVAGNAQGEPFALTLPQSGEHMNETTFLIAPGAVGTAEVTVWEGEATHIALFSDGLQHLALRMPSGEPHAPFFAPLFRFVENLTPASQTESQEQLHAFLVSPRITGRTDDDLTLLLAARTAQE